MPTESDKCPHCNDVYGETGDWGRDGEHYCIDCWPGYNLCKACGDYRCEHIIPTEEDLKDKEFTSCHCENSECRAGFVEGSKDRIVNRREFDTLIKSWGHEGLKDFQGS